MLGKYYKSIDEMPIFNWNKCLDGDFKYVHSELKEDVINETMFNDVYDDFLKQRGLDKTLNNIFKVMKKKAILECDYLISRDRFLLTLIEIEEAKLNSLRKPSMNNAMSFEKTLVYLSKWLGFGINAHKTSTKQYFAYLDEYIKNN